MISEKTHRRGAEKSQRGAEYKPDYDTTAFYFCPLPLYNVEREPASDRMLVEEDLI
jgi:hypothetical protein